MGDGILHSRSHSFLATGEGGKREGGGNRHSLELNSYQLAQGTPWRGGGRGQADLLMGKG